MASVTTSGGLATVTGLRAGTATITYMTSTGAQGSFTVTVGGSSTTNPDLPNVTPQGTYEMEVGGTKSLAFANTNVARVETSDSSIATGTTYTSSSGKIGARFTGKKAGTCIGYLYTSSGSVSAVNLVVTGDGEVDIDPDDAIGRWAPSSRATRLARGGPHQRQLLCFAQGDAEQRASGHGHWRKRQLLPGHLQLERQELLRLRQKDLRRFLSQGFFNQGKTGRTFGVRLSFLFFGPKALPGSLGGRSG